MYEAFYILLSLCNFRLAMTTKESKCSIKYPEQIDYFLTKHAHAYHFLFFFRFQKDASEKSQFWTPKPKCIKIVF